MAVSKKINMNVKNILEEEDKDISETSLDRDKELATNYYTGYSKKNDRKSENKAHVKYHRQSYSMKFHVGSKDNFEIENNLGDKKKDFKTKIIEDFRSYVENYEDEPILKDFKKGLSAYIDSEDGDIFWEDIHKRKGFQTVINMAKQEKDRLQNIALRLDCFLQSGRKYLQGTT